MSLDWLCFPGLAATHCCGDRIWELLGEGYSCMKCLKENTCLVSDGHPRLCLIRLSSLLILLCVVPGHKSHLGNLSSLITGLSVKGNLGDTYLITFNCSEVDLANLPFQ